MHGKLISDSSFAELTNWFELPENEQEVELGGLQNGYGIVRYGLKETMAVGHSGGIDGFSSQALYFPAEDMAVIMLFNSVGNEDGGYSALMMINEALDEMFE